MRIGTAQLLPLLLTGGFFLSAQPAAADGKPSVWCICWTMEGNAYNYTHQRIMAVPSGCRNHRVSMIPASLEISDREANKACRTGFLPVKSPPPMAKNTSTTKSASKKKKKSGKKSSTASAPVPRLRVPEKGVKPDSPYNTDIIDAARKHEIPELLLHAVIRVESNYNPKAVSSAGAKGLMQLMPATAKELGVKDSFNPRDNVMGGARYLKRLSNHFKGDVVKILAGYHAGFRAVEREDGIPFAATEGYVKKVLGHYYRMKQAESAKGGAK